MKKLLVFTAALAMLLSLAAPAFAAGGYTDVPDNAWYAGAVQSLKDQGLMEGMGDGRFAPGNAFTRAQLAMVLYRMAGCPAVSGDDEFTDTYAGAWYSDAIVWASQNRVVEGYGNGLYGPNNPVTQEQVAVMLWRSAGSTYMGNEYALDNGEENVASSWAADGVRWARVMGLFSAAVEFSPKKNASRAQVADMLDRYMKLPRNSDGSVMIPAPASKGPKAAVVYFSCTGTTEKIALDIAESLGIEAKAIKAKVPYTEDDLNWNSDSSRSSIEQNDPSARPEMESLIAGLEDCDIVFLGYPIWHGQAPKIMYTFVESCDLSGKTVVPFCTSGNSPIGSSATNLSASAPGAKWLTGRRFGSGSLHQTVTDWVNSLGLGLEAK
ncbi:MAG: S-layer homology domain-containing protein [Firmicutes bacterium]|nr:S-layer homology domain-containing protein [Bacillota bacterium]